MKRGGQFEWDDQNAGHIALHNVTPDEVEQVIANDPISLEVAIRKGRTAYPMRWLDGPRPRAQGGLYGAQRPDSSGYRA